MEIGKLRRRVALQSKTATRNTFGEMVYTWATTATVWGSVEPLSARELLSASAELQEVTTRIVVRYLSSVTPEMRATWNGHTYDIESVIADARSTMMTLLCTEAI